MKIALVVARVLVGLMFIWASIAYFFGLGDASGMPEQLTIYNQALGYVYVMPIVKTLELICGILLIVNLFVPLAVVVLFPILINILLVHLFLAPQGLVVAIPMILLDLFIAWSYRGVYSPMFQARPARS